MLSGLDILVVEDEVLVARALQMSLALHDADRVTFASTLREAESITRLHRFDVIVLDRCLPDGDSYELGRALVSLGIPVVVHSGHADAQECILSGAFFCPKPAHATQICEAVASAVKAREDLLPRRRHLRVS